MSKNNYQSFKIPIKGMHCCSCEILLEEQLKEVEHVKNVKTNYRRGEAIIYYDEIEPSQSLLKEKIVSAGYIIGSVDKLPLVVQSKKEYLNLAIAFAFLVAVFFLLKGFGFLNFNFGSGFKNPSFLVVILIGIVAGFSTCMALVGGLSLGLSAKFIESRPTATVIERFRPHLFFVGGRIISYALLGGALGLLGEVIRFSPFANGILMIIVGLVMLVMGIQLINIFPRFSNFKITLPKSVSKYLGATKNNREYNHFRAFFLGALTFFLPCGFTQAMQLYAISTGSFWSGFLVMGLFALGTAPGLLGIGGLASVVKGVSRKRFFKFAGLAVIFFALFNLNNGYHLVELNFDGFSKSKKTTNQNVAIENGVQIIRMVENSNGYTPNNFSLKKGVPVKLIIDAQEPYSCASSIIIPKLGIEKNLQAGENVIEFTPQEVGKLLFSCSMGMYTGAFNIFDDSSININSCDSESASGVCPINQINKSAGNKKIALAAQVIKTSFVLADDIQPNRFTVKVGQPVRLEVEAKEDGEGCMSQIEIPGLYDEPQSLIAGKTVVMEFTPQKPGKYLITCAMGIVRGWITVE